MVDVINTCTVPTVWWWTLSIHARYQLFDGGRYQYMHGTNCLMLDVYQYMHGTNCLMLDVINTCTVPTIWCWTYINTCTVPNVWCWTLSIHTRYQLFDAGRYQYIHDTNYLMLDVINTWTVQNVWCWTLLIHERWTRKRRLLILFKTMYTCSL